MYGKTLWLKLLSANVLSLYLFIKFFLKSFFDICSQRLSFTWFPYHEANKAYLRTWPTELPSALPSGVYGYNMETQNVDYSA